MVKVIITILILLISIIIQINSSNINELLKNSIKDKEKERNNKNDNKQEHKKQHKSDFRKNNDGEFTDITTSLIGKYVYACTAAGSIYGSSVYGKEWFKSAENVNYNDFITTDYTGRYVYAIGSTIGKSDNYAQSWITVNKVDNDWTGISTDRWGQWVYAITTDKGIYVANDWGSTWIQRGPITGFNVVDTNRYTYSEFQLTGPDSNAWAIATNNDIYNTDDDGVTWNLISSNKFGKDTVTSLETSDFGNLIFVGTQSGKLYRSDNHASTFTIVQTLDKPISTISCDGSCQLVTFATGDIAGNIGGSIYESTDYGINFDEAPYGNHVWTKITTSKPGNFMYAVSFSGFVGKIH